MSQPAPAPPREHSDTDPKTYQVWLELMRSKSLSERLTATIQFIDFSRQVYEAGLRMAHPGASEAEVRRLIAFRCLPKELAIAAYGDSEVTTAS